MKSKLSKEKEQTIDPQPTRQPLNIEEVLREKYEAVVVPPPSIAPLAATKKPIARTSKIKKGRVRDVVRVSVDFPRELYNTVVEETDEKEQTLRDFMLSLVRVYFGQKAK